MDRQNNRFAGQLDTVLVIDKPIRENLGEDSFYCAAGKTSAIISVCDGCGGLGARKYESLQGHTGAYMASRIVSGAISGWYHKNYHKKWENIQRFAASIDACIREAYAVCEPYGIEKMKIMGSMVRKFPTTLALAYAEAAKDGICLHLLWAGDSRIYLLDTHGLAQLTEDDTDGLDAYENLFSDGAMTNVLSSDGKYGLHYRTIHLHTPCLIFAATDGCFGYIPSPMEFEYTVLHNIHTSKTPDEFKKNLKADFMRYAEDDLTLGLMSFFYGSFEQMQEQLSERMAVVEECYIRLLSDESDDTMAKELWLMYKPEYERYLKKKVYTVDGFTGQQEGICDRKEE